MNVGNLPSRVRGGPVRGLRKHEPVPICRPKHKIWYQVWSRSQGLPCLDFVFAFSLLSCVLVILELALA